jgi:hypothetical protein
VFKVKRDWRISYVCGSTPYFTMLRANERFVVPTAGGVTQRVIAELGIHFLVMSTTANLMAGSGTTPGRQVTWSTCSSARGRCAERRHVVPDPGSVAPLADSGHARAAAPAARCSGTAAA